MPSTSETIFKSAQECVDLVATRERMNLRPASHGSVDQRVPDNLLPSPSSLHVFLVQELLPCPSCAGASGARAAVDAITP
jgi:hypothetical protein